MDPADFAGRVRSPLGDLLIFLNGDRLTGLRIEPARPGPSALRAAATGDPLFDAVREQLESYFRSEREAFDLPIDPPGPAFDRKVWSVVQAVPFGQTVSYGEIARRIGKPGAARAVGSANARNPLMIVTPCHRVVAATGRLAGTGPGREWRRRLLEHEGLSVHNGRVIPAGPCDPERGR